MVDEQVQELDPSQLPPPPQQYDPCESSTDTAGIVSLVGPGQHPATWLPAAFRKWGVRFRVVAGWETRGRPPSSGGFNPVGVLVHHTGTTSSAADPNPALGVVTNGRPDLAGPLCQVSTGFDGVTTIVAAGRANHAGRSKAFGPVPAGDGNALLIGNEVQTDGTQRMPDEQYRAVVLATAAILDHLGATHTSSALHATTSYDGKWDLGAGDGVGGHPFNLTRLRADVAATLTAGPTPGGFLMALTDAQQQELLDLTRLVKARLFGVFPQRYKRRDPSDPTGRRYVPCDPGDEGATPATGLDQLDGNTIMQNLGAILDLLGATQDVDALASAIAGKLGAGASAAQIAKATVDELAARVAPVDGTAP